jgi:hypothetical protein
VDECETLLHGLGGTGRTAAGATLSERRQFLSLAKLSKLAAGTPSHAEAGTEG